LKRTIFRHSGGPWIGACPGLDPGSRAGAEI